MYQCKCGRQFDAPNSFNGHKRFCSVHRNGIPPSGVRKKGDGYTPPNKGKTLEQLIGEDRAKEAKKKMSDFMIKRHRDTPTVHSSETKQRISIARINVLETSKHIPWFDVGGIKVQGNWERNVAIRLTELGYQLDRHKVRYDNHRHYTPDFYIPGLNVYVEVKGWLSDRDVEKYKKVFESNPNLRIVLIRNERGMNNYSKFISGLVSLDECEDLKNTILGS